MSESENPDSTPAPEVTPAPEPKPVVKSKKGRIDRTVIGLNVFVQLILIFILVVWINAYGFQHFTRWDLSHNQNYALSSKTKNLLRQLDQPVRATVFFPQAQILSKDVAGLLREYEYAAKKKFSVEYVDPYKNLSRAKELLEKYKFGTSDNIVILDYKGKTKFVNAADMAELDNSGAMLGQPPTMRAFKGEEAMTSALQELTDDKQNKLYVLAGHGEPELEGPSLASFKTYVQRENIKLASLNLNNVNEVPSDATGVLIFGTKNDLSEREVQLVEDYWTQRKGRVLALLNPTAKTARLNDWVARQGVLPQGDRVLKTGTGIALENGQPVLKSGIIASPLASFAAEGKPILKEVAGVDTQLLGATESLVLDRARSQVDKIKLTPLLQAGEGFWGETEYMPGENRNVFFDPKKDHMGPLTLAAAVEKGGLEDPRVKVETARMIVVGNANFLTEEGLQMSPTGIDFVLVGLNWMFNRETVSGIPPKPKQALSLRLDDREVNRIFYTAVIAIPLTSGIIGLFVSWHRRNRNLLVLTAWLLGIGLALTGLFWSLNLYLMSRESGTAVVTLRSYAIPAALLVVPLLAFALRVMKTNAEAEPADLA